MRIMAQKIARYRRRSGYNRKVGSSPKKGGDGWFAKALLLLIVGAAVCAFFTVPVMGKTPYKWAEQTIRGEAAKSGNIQKKLSELQKSDTDKLTDKDMKGLQNLIEKKLPARGK